MKRREGVFSPKAQNGTYTNFTHRKEIYYINIHTNIRCSTYIQILHFLVHKNSVFLQYLLDDPSFRNLSTASSTSSLAILIVSNTSFMAGSASRLYGSGGGESSAAVKNKLLIQS
jgi:hypothetical protein